MVRPLAAISESKNRNKVKNWSYTLIADLIIMLLFITGSVFVYELSNYLTFIAFGLTPTVSWSSLLPSGVAASGSCGSCITLLKPVQVILSMLLISPTYLAIRRFDTRLAKFCMLGVASIYLASIYWEALSFLASVPVSVHQLLFVAATSATMMVLVRTIQSER
ncbi:MAG: hypothetical protein QXV32_03590 [Conexivisphaerales archaeon]